MDHPELAHVTHVDQTEKTPTFYVVPRRETRHVLAIQTTDMMLENIKWINKAAQAMIRYDLDDDSKVGVVTFNNVTKIEHDIAALDDENIREKVADTVPGKYQLVSHNETCVTCMLGHVVNHVLNEDTDGAHIVVVLTVGANITENVTEIMQLLQGAKVSFIVLPRAEETTRVTDVSKYDDMAKLTGGDTFLVANSLHEMELYYNILSSLHVALGGGRARSVHNKHHLEHEHISQGSFYTWDQDVMFRIYVPDTEDHMIKSVTFENLETGNVYGPYTKMSASYDLINIKTPNIVGDLPWVSENSSKKHWNYTVEWYSGNRDIKSIIDITSGMARDQVQVQSWVSAVDTWSCADQFQHIKISAVMTTGHVTGVEIFAHVQILADSGLEYQEEDVKLTQDNDDTVSAVILDYPASGRYSIQVRAEDRITGETHIDPHVHVVRLSHVPTADCVPPAPVNDLNIAIFNNSDVITATWTAVAGDMNVRDSVESYKIVVSDDVCQLMDDVASAETVLNIQSRAASGDFVEQVLQWTRYDQMLYVAVVGVDAAGNVGHVSNIVTVFVPSPISTDPDLEAVSLSQSESILDNYQSIIIISSSLGGVLMICLICIIYIIISGRYRHQSKASRTVTPDYTIEQCVTEGVTDVQQILARERQSQATGSVQASLPVYWSCDQILTRSTQDHGHKAQIPAQNHHNYYNCQAGDLSPSSRYSCSSDSYSSNATNTATDIDSYRGHSSPYHSAATHSSLATAVTDVTDEGYDSASRELELINSRKLYTIV